MRLAVPGFAQGIACDGCPPLPSLIERFTSAGGELLVCPICLDARKLDASQLAPNARRGGTVPMWEWIGDEAATAFSY